MATTVTYKNNTLVTVNNQTKTLKTAGKFLEDDITLVDISGGTAAISVVDTADAAGGNVRTITALDISDTTAVAGDVASGKYFYTADGVKTAGTGSGGGSGGSVSPKQVNFIDYDGTVLYSYTAQEAQALSALPANPSHTGLTAQGWNWSLAQIKAQLTAIQNGDVWVGQMYITQSGDTEIDVSMPEGRLDPILTICVNGTVTVDWGDNTTADTVNGSSISSRLAVSHTYAAPGDYTIKIHATSGNFTFFGSSSNGYLLLRKNTSSNQSRVYTSCIRAIRIGAGITRLYSEAFVYCSNLTYVTIPSEVTYIDTSAFRYCYHLLSVTIPSDVTTLPQLAIAECRNMCSVAIPSGLTSIGSNTFGSCSNLTSITLPSGLTSIGSSAFSNCYHLTSITIPSGVTTIDSNVFSSCSSLSSITLLGNVTSIGSAAFSSCSSLSSITLPNTVTSIGSSAFSSCYSLSSITPPSNVTSIGSSAFAYCSSLSSITLPSRVTNIDSTTFSGCSSLTSITILGNVTNIGSDAFRNCYILRSITLPNSVTAIGNTAFNTCYALTSITVPSDVTTIGNSTFHSCFGVAEYHIKPTTPPTLGTTAFANISSDCVIYVPSAKLADYQAAENWSAYASYMQGE